MNPEITIGLTFYNNAGTLKDALRSIFAQTFQDWELITIDDHSTDGSFEIVQSIKDSRVHVYKEEERKGFVSALNRMAQLAKGKYYARMDADDLMHPERLLKQITYLKENPGIDLVDTSMYSMDQRCQATGIRYVDSSSVRPDKVLRRGLLHHATVMGHIEWFRKNPYDPEYVRAEDYELWCRTCKTSSFGRMKEPLYFVREGRVNLNNYLLSGQTVRRIIKTYGPLLVGRKETTKLLAKSYGKSLAYRLFALFNAHEILVDMRNGKLSNYKKATANTIIR
ncbi:MAG: glycosyltransferase family 2 protein, partial [Anaerolineaceae bacterium]